jgi:glycine/D-amino acid oxidase-like deaminating enzyme
MSDSTPRNIVIIGGGIMGCTTAYYISRHHSFSPSTRVTILEASKHGAAQGASGKAGGLISKNAYPDELVGVSFREVSLPSGPMIYY